MRCAVNVDLMVLRLEDDDAEQVVVMYGRCQHRGALMADAHIQGDKILSVGCMARTIFIKLASTRVI